MPSAVGTCVVYAEKNINNRLQAYTARQRTKKISKKTRNTWQRLAYSQLGAVVSPPSEYEPRECTSDGQRRGAIYHVLYNIYYNRYNLIRTSN